MILNDIDNKWNYIELIIKEAEAYKEALNNLVEENSVL
jgi:hypothetical protein